MTSMINFGLFQESGMTASTWDMYDTYEAVREAQNADAGLSGNCRGSVVCELQMQSMEEFMYTLKISKLTSLMPLMCARETFCGKATLQ